MPESKPGGVQASKGVGQSRNGDFQRDCVVVQRQVHRNGRHEAVRAQRLFRDEIYFSVLIREVISADGVYRNVYAECRNASQPAIGHASKLKPRILNDPRANIGARNCRVAHDWRHIVALPKRFRAVVVVMHLVRGDFLGIAEAIQDGGFRKLDHLAKTHAVDRQHGAWNFG